MPKREQLYVISYDISRDKIRNKVANELENNGKRVQYSVFECTLTAANFRKLYQKLLQLCSNEEPDSIRIYTLCENCVEKIQIIGVEKEKKEEEPVIII